MSKQKLELTWIGKDETVKLEPRILIEDPEKSYGDKNSENMLIHGDNLLALKALEQDFAGKFKCIYIDPPYNTGSRIDSDGKEIGYDDGLEHSEWLNMMRPRLEIMKTLLCDDGILAVQIDDNEYARLYLLLAEIFFEKNIKTICVKMSEPTGVKMASVNKTGGIAKLKEYIILASKRGIKGLTLEKIPKGKWDNEYKTICLNVTRDDLKIIKDISEDELRSDHDVDKVNEILKNIEFANAKDTCRSETGKDAAESWYYENAWRVVQFATLTGGAKDLAVSTKLNFSKTPSAFSIITSRKKMYLIRGDFNHETDLPRCKILFADLYLEVHAGDFWYDIKTTGLDNEGGVAFKKGKKPEALLKRVISMCTIDNDWVLDSFAGSGTTGAVAHKMKRKWVMVEMANHCFTHTILRLKSVIKGEDSQGVSEAMEWKGGGGFKFYELAPSLLKKDKYDNWIIEEKYNANMLAAAVCKHEAFKFFPDPQVYWKQGKSTETDYIFVTTSFVTAEQVDKIQEEMQPGESLLICARSFQEACVNRHAGINIKKIPQMILGKCEFAKDNYDLNIVNAPQEDDAEGDE